MAIKIYSVDDIKFDSHGLAGKTRVIVKGMVNTGGWAAIRLIPTVGDPKDRFIDLDIVGTKPSGIVTQGFVEVNTSLEVEKGSYLGVRVHAATNDLQKEF